MSVPMSGRGDVSVLIVGAGPTGLTLACELARRGVVCRIVEKAPEYFAGSRGKGLQPRTLEVFDDLGIVTRVLASGADYPKFRVHMPWITLTWDMFKRSKQTPDVPYPNTWLVPQSRAEAILRDRLAEFGVSVELATELTDFEQDENGVTATLSHSGVTERIRADYLVGADGGRSFVRKALGVGFEGKTLEGERMLVGDVHVDGLSREYWHVWPRARGGQVALCPLPGGDLFQFTADLSPNGEPPELTERAVQALFTQATGRRDIRLHTPSWLSIYHPNVRMVNRYRVGRVFLAGDAAHVHPPEGGQGLNTGVQDAYNLGWKLAQTLAGAPDALLDTYEEERMPIAAYVLGISSSLHQRIRKQRRDSKTQQLLLNYRGGTLASDDLHASGRLQAGDRAPDAPCQDATGNPMRLFDAFRGPHFTLLAFGGDQAAVVAEANERYGPLLYAYSVVRGDKPGNAPAIIDANGYARKAYDVKDGACVLIRPDGYVALVTRKSDLKDVDAYLQHVTATPLTSSLR